MTSAEFSGGVLLRGPGETYLALEGSQLCAGSPQFERVWRLLADGTLLAESFQDRISGVQWIAQETNLTPGASPNRITLNAAPRRSAVEADSLTAELCLASDAGTTIWRLQIWPSVRGVRVTRHINGGLTKRAGGGGDERANGVLQPTGVESDESAFTVSASEVSRTRTDGFALAPLHIRLSQVSFHDRTDEHNELTWEREWLLHTCERALSLSGCLFGAEDILTGAGLIFLKESPLPECRPVPTPCDLQVSPIRRELSLNGEADSLSEVEYPVVVLGYDGGKFGRIAALQAYQRALRPYKPGRDGLLLSNTWGDRNRDGRIHAEFMAQEIEAGARLGVDIVQIDDGWESGTTSNSVNAQSEGGVWEGFYAARDNFWSVHPMRFPDGLESLVASAEAYGMRFGLWFGPDSSNDFGAWLRDADTLISLHRKHRIDYFKIDGVKVRSRLGERNLHAFFDRVLDETDGKVTFDLDITAETRPGYFGLAHAGPLFVENRYTDWHRYWPHHTLRNLWSLAHHVDPIRLRMEWLNNARNLEVYANDPLAPSAYRPDYLFATVMFSSPLGWFEVSSLPESYLLEAAPLIATWKRHREQMFEGVILPIGDAPDGVSWTGFVSITSEFLYVLVFREHNASAEWCISLPFAPEVATEIQADRLAGDGEAKLLPGRLLQVTIPQRQRFYFGRIETAV